MTTVEEKIRSLSVEERALERASAYMAITHQKLVGTGYFDRVMNCITDGESSVGALSGSTEEAQFSNN